MALSWSVCSVLVLVACVQASPVDFCDPDDPTKVNIADNVIPDVFHQCMPDGTSVMRQCPYSTIFDGSLMNCNFMSLAHTNPACPCGASINENTKCAHVCCSLYWECVNGVRVVGACGDGFVFDSSTRSCRSTSLTSCEDYSFCANTVQTAVVSAKSEDSQCRASARLQFTSVPTLYSDKESKQLSSWVESVGYTASSLTSSATFGTDTNGNPGYLYIPYFKINELISPWAIAVTFSYPNPTSGASFSLVSDEYQGSDGLEYCGSPSLKLAATYSNGQWTITAQAVGDSATDSVSTSISSNTASIAVKLRFNGALGLQVGSGTLQYSNNIGTRVSLNKCALEVGRGLVGTLTHFAVHEGCGNFDLL